MGATGVLTAADADGLRIYCESVARYRHAAQLLDQSGPLITATGRGARRGELVKNPLHQIVRDNAVLVRAFARELGLTRPPGSACGPPTSAMQIPSPSSSTGRRDDDSREGADRSER